MAGASSESKLTSLCVQAVGRIYGSDDATVRQTHLLRFCYSQFWMEGLPCLQPIEPSHSTSFPSSYSSSPFLCPFDAPPTQKRYLFPFVWVITNSVSVPPRRQVAIKCYVVALYRATLINPRNADWPLVLMISP